MEQEILKIENIRKVFPGVVALDDVSMSIKKGEIHGLVGENGAGKSTLIKSIMGVYQAEAGHVYLQHDEKWVEPKNAFHAKHLGMYANYQHVNIASTLSVGENYFLGQLPHKKWGVVDWDKVYQDSQKILKEFKLDIDPRAKIDGLSIAMKEMVMISKISTFENLKLVIFDEPTALLENDKIEILFDYIKQLKNNGISIIYISHHLEEIMKICDRVTVLKDGQYVATEDINNVDKNKLISMMVGRKIDDIYNINHKGNSDAEEILKIEHLTKKGQFEDVSLSVAAGEIVGMFGLVGAGRTEAMKTIYGIQKPDSGQVFLRGQAVKIKSASAAMKKGIGLIPEDRQREGVALPLSVKVNINLNSYDIISKMGFINVKKEASRAREYVKKVGVKTTSIEQKVEDLSGGNQQKVVISKLLCRNLDIFIFDEPTVGVDIGARQEIYKLIEKLANEGKAIVIISSYLPEIMGLSDKIVVMSEGKMVGEIFRDEIDLWKDENILRLASNVQ